MKKICLLLVFMFAFFISEKTVYADWNREFSRLNQSFQMLISFDIGYAYNAGMNNSAKNSAQAYADSKPSSTVDNSPAKWLFGLDADLRYFYYSFGIGLQAGAHFVNSESEVTAAGWAGSESTAFYELLVVPVVATLYYRTEINSLNLFFLAGAGAGYYYGEMDCDDDNRNDVSKYETFKQTKIGYHILVELDYASDNGYMLFTGLKARYVQFDEFKADGIVLKEYGSDKNLKAGLTGISWYFGAGFTM